MMLGRFTEEEKQLIIEDVEYKILLRTVLVLGRIGDGRALPTLEALLPSGDEYLRSHVQVAIDKVRQH